MQIPDEFKNRMQSMLKGDYPAFLQAFTQGGEHTAIRINVLKQNARESIFAVAGQLEPVPWCPDGYYTDKSKLSGRHPYHIAGLFYFQEPSAMAVVEALAIEPDDRVLDLCAAPGGKATQAGVKLQGSGLLVANEIISKRSAVLAENIERMGIRNAVVTNESPEKLTAYFPSFFDKIIVDAPCSGEGMFRKEPQAVTEWSEEHTRSCAVRQAAILDSAAQMLAPGGKLVYSTCTFAPCENEGVVDALLSRHPELSLCEISGMDMLPCGNGDWVDSQWDLTNTKRIFPHTNRGEGHFLALFEKKRQKNVSHETTLQKEEKKAVWYREFEKQFLNIKLDGQIISFGDHLYLKPSDTGDFTGIRIVRPGLHLGICKKGRFEPSHALLYTLSRQNIKNTLSFQLDADEIGRYLRGETLSCDWSGWGAVCADEYPLGWGKASGGILKNHFPKFMRLK